MLRLYYADVSNIDLGKEFTLSQYRKKRLETIWQEEKRRQSIGAERLLNKALEELYPGFKPPADIILDNNGKPYISSKPLYFSLAHSGNIAACAVSDNNIGLDVQIEEAPREKIMRRVFSTRESEYVLSATDKNHAFTEVWTKKESKVKKSGAGIGAMLSIVDILDDEYIWHAVIDKYHFAISLEEKAFSEPEMIIKTEL